MRRTLVLLVALLAFPVAARGEADAPPPPPAPSKPAPPPAPVGDPAAAARANELLTAIAADGPAQPRLDAAAELAKLGPPAVPALAAFLRRPRTSTEIERRAVLAAIHAEVPDKTGKFAQPTRAQIQKEAGQKEVDWLPALAALEPRPGLGEVIADVAVIRALGASHDVSAATDLFDFSFHGDAVIYRDECGRTLRAMSPYSLPALFRESRHKDVFRARYANYQLERLDRQNAFKALQGAQDDATRIAILAAFADVKHPDAVQAVLATTDDISPAVRKAARTAWLAYVVGPAPPPAPKRRLQLPGGKLTPKPMPLWLTYRELADIELRRTLTEVTGSEPAVEATPEEMSHELFALYDGKRTAALDGTMAAAAAPASAGKWEEVVRLYDDILVLDPMYARRGDMAAGYLARADELAAAKKWRDAMLAYGAAQAVAPAGPLAGKAEAGLHYARGMALEAAGQDGSLELGRAHKLAPERDDVHDALAEATGGGRRAWMLWAGVAAGAGGLLLMAFALARRARATW